MSKLGTGVVHIPKSIPCHSGRTQVLEKIQVHVTHTHTQSSLNLVHEVSSKLKYLRWSMKDLVNKKAVSSFSWSAKLQKLELA